jgi:MFS family permease
MIALGCSDGQIGLITSVGMAFQIIFALLSGAITDKLGRRLTTLIFDIISWSIPTMIWALAQNFYFFMAAAAVNGIMKITQNSWTCLLVEDTQKDKLVTIWSWITIAITVSGLAAPLSGLLVQKIDLVPAVRILYGFAFISMTLKFIILYKYSDETAAGKIRMQETKNTPLLHLIGGYKKSLKTIWSTSYTLNAFFISFILIVYDTIRNVFWSIMVVKELNLPDFSIGIFPFIKSGILLLFYFLVIPKIDHLKFKNPFLIGFSLLIFSNIVLVLSPPGSYLFVGISTFLDAVAIALISPFKETLLVDAVDAKDRAGILGLFNLAIIILASPFGWVAGILSEQSRLWPFFILIGASAIGLIFVFNILRHKQSFDHESQ